MMLQVFLMQDLRFS